MATGTDKPIYKRALYQAHRQLLADINPDELLDVFIEEEYLPEQTLQDIRASTLVSCLNIHTLDNNFSLT